MVQWQISTLEHLMHSGFGRPAPRHGLQLLFWFAKTCVTCERNNPVVVMMLVSNCQPESGVYGFHIFGNIEELLPVLSKQTKRKKQVAYFEVGNLNAETYPASANLPKYVRKYYKRDGYRGHGNVDRIIIRYQVRTRVVEMVYVTEHDTSVFGRFSPGRTHEISPELITALQEPQLDLTTFLTQTGYYGGMEVAHVGDIGQTWCLEPTMQQLLEVARSLNGNSGNLTGAFNQGTDINITSFSYNGKVAHYVSNNPTTCYDQQRTTHYDVQPYNYMRSSTIRAPRGNAVPSTFLEGFGFSTWESDDGPDEEAKKRLKELGISIAKVLLSAGALYLLAKCFSWMMNCQEVDCSGKGPWMSRLRLPRAAVHHSMPIILDYVY